MKVSHQPTTGRVKIKAMLTDLTRCSMHCVGRQECRSVASIIRWVSSANHTQALTRVTRTSRSYAQSFREHQASTPHDPID